MGDDKGDRGGGWEWGRMQRRWTQEPALTSRDGKLWMGDGVG